MEKQRNENKNLTRTVIIWVNIIVSIILIIILVKTQKEKTPCPVPTTWNVITQTCDNSIKPTMQTWPTTLTNNEPQQPAPIQPKDNSEVICSEIKYSDWSLCSESGTRIRSIVSAYPQGCNLGNDAKQQESCIYVPIKLDAETLIQKIFQQVSKAPNKTIETEYISGQYGNVTATVRYAITGDNNLVIWTESKDRQSGKIMSNVYLKDSNQDFRPDFFSNDGAEWYLINTQPQTNQGQILIAWATQITYFAENLLDH